MLNDGVFYPPDPSPISPPLFDGRHDGVGSGESCSRKRVIIGPCLYPSAAASSCNQIRFHPPPATTCHRLTAAAVFHLSSHLAFELWSCRVCILPRIQITCTCTMHTRLFIRSPFATCGHGRYSVIFPLPKTYTPQSLFDVK